MQARGQTAFLMAKPALAMIESTSALVGVASALHLYRLLPPRSVALRQAHCLPLYLAKVHYQFQVAHSTPVSDPVWLECLA